MTDNIVFDITGDTEPIGFSILVPVYNAQAYLGQCLNSIEAQQWPNLEVILVDDGSTDASVDICDRYAKRNPSLYKVLHKKNEGPLLARKSGLLLASKEYVLFVDADDALLPNALSAISAAISTTQADVVRWSATRNVVRKSPDSSRIKCTYYPEAEKPHFLRALCQSPSGSENALWAKAVRKNCVGADVDLTAFRGLTFAEDFLQTVIIYDHAKTFAVIDTQIYFYRPGSGITNSYATHMFTDVCRCMDFAKPYAERWQEVWQVDGLVAGLAACKLDSAAQLAEYLAGQHDIEGLQKLRESHDVIEALDEPGSAAFLNIRRAISIWALKHGLYSILNIPLWVKKFARRR